MEKLTAKELIKEIKNLEDETQKMEPSFDIPFIISGTDNKDVDDAVYISEETKEQLASELAYVRMLEQYSENVSKGRNKR